MEGDTSQLFDHRRYEKVVTHSKRAILGHNRSKTIGDARHRNAHPFSFENIVGVHNGTLTYDCRRRLETAGHKYETDSEQLYSHINDNGIENTIKLMEGAWALVWWDKRNGTMNFLRNKERPMVYCFDDAHSTLYWASEVAMLYLVLNRHNVSFGNQKESKPFYLNEDTLYSWAIPNFNAQFEKPTRQKMEAPKSFPFVVTSSMPTQSGKFGRNQAETHFSPTQPELVRRRQEALRRIQSTTGATSTSCMIPTKADAEVMNQLQAQSKVRMSTLQTNHERPFYFGHNNDLRLTREMFEIKMLDGCSNCSQQPVWGEPVKFCRDNTFICADCMISNKDEVVHLAADLM